MLSIYNLRNKLITVGLLPQFIDKKNEGHKEQVTFSKSYSLHYQFVFFL